MCILLVLDFTCMTNAMRYKKNERGRNVFEYKSLKDTREVKSRGDSMLSNRSIF